MSSLRHVGCLLRFELKKSILISDDINLPRIQVSLPNGSLPEKQLKNINSLLMHN